MIRKIVARVPDIYDVTWSIIVRKIKKLTPLVYEKTKAVKFYVEFYSFCL